MVGDQPADGGRPLRLGTLDAGSAAETIALGAAEPGALWAEAAEPACMAL
ncbi:hypothetical protein GCM10023107_05900 [Actinoplanes octamycinicus]|nr:hypothetical protein Aoc01nite_07500 [Actinoplanes octamycinicus]